MTIELKLVTAEGGLDLLLNGQRVAFIDVFDEKKPKLVVDLSENEQVFIYAAPDEEGYPSVSVPKTVQLQAHESGRDFLAVPAVD